MDRATAAALLQSKSTGLAFFLALFFGGLGLLYATVAGGLIVCLLELGAFVIAVGTLGMGAILIPVVHLIAIFWAVVAVQAHNRALLARLADR